MSKEIDNQEQGGRGHIMSRHRLAEISHHFLSDEQERLPAWENTFIVPVLLGSKNDDYVVYELDRAFNQQQRSSMVLNIESQLMATASLSAFVSGKAESDADDEANMPDFCLIPVTSPSTTLALQSDRLIIAVHASLAGVRMAYKQLAFMASLETNFNVCAVMLGAKNLQQAKRFYGFLYDNAQSLLALQLECGGFLLQNNELISGNEESMSGAEKESIPTSMVGVAKSILDSFKPGINRPIAPQLAAPGGVAALLS
jgi:hypothetical protein